MLFRENGGRALFGRKKKTKSQKLEYDKSLWKPVLKCSICNGEQVGGLRNITTGEFREVMFVRGSEDLNLFKNITGEQTIEKIY